MASDSLIERQRKELDDRIEELRPQAEEYETLMAYRESMNGAGASAPRARRAAGATRAPAAAKPTTNGRRRRRSAGKVDRPGETLAFVKANPGATISEVAKGIGVSQNYLYRVRDGLVKKGALRADEKGALFVTEEGGKAA